MNRHFERNSVTQSASEVAVFRFSLLLPAMLCFDSVFLFDFGDSVKEMLYAN